MLDFLSSTICLGIVHEVGNKSNGDLLHLSKTNLELIDSNLNSTLIQLLSNAFQAPEFYHFTSSNLDHQLNPMFQFAKKMFEEEEEQFQINSCDIARYLFDVSDHQNIKTGDLLVMFLKDVQHQGMMHDALVVFKFENKQNFITINVQQSQYLLEAIEGVNIEKIDKACIILNEEQQKGYKLSIFDKSGKSAETQYWRDKFLNITPCNDDYHATKDYLALTKDFVSKQIEEEFEVNSAEKIDFLNKSVAYFKTNETFNKEEFAQHVFYDENIIDAFNTYEKTFSLENGLDLQNEFVIDSQAVKRQSKMFKSILKLDKNFHVYIHGNKDMIEQGVEHDGRKFYKLYYDEES